MTSYLHKVLIVHVDLSLLQGQVMQLQQVEGPGQRLLQVLVANIHWNKKILSHVKGTVSGEKLVNGSLEDMVPNNRLHMTFTFFWSAVNCEF